MEERMQTSNKEIQIIIRELTRVLNNNITGDVVEFGCYQGGTSIYLSDLIEKLSDKKLYVYDSFEGLPEKTNKDQSVQGESFKPGELLASKKQFIKNLQKAKVRLPIIKKAWFSDLTADDVPRLISFAYLDSDYYQSIKDSLRLIRPYLSLGSVVVIDDYYNESLPGVKVAVDEWLSNNGAKLKVENSLAILYL